MTPQSKGLDIFANDLNPTIVGTIRSWQGDEELDALYHRIQHRTTRRGFLDAFAEAIVANHARKHGCSIQVEVKTPSGKTCDLLLEKDGAKLYIHVKRLGGRQPANKRITISSRLRVLENIQRKWIVKIRWHQGLTDEQMQLFVTNVASFIEIAKLGDEFVARDEEKHELGGAKIMAPHDGDRVSLVIGLSEGFQDDTVKVTKLLNRAHQQFMPKEANLMLVCTSDLKGADEVESALLGGHVERWDEHPQKGKRVAHGRSDDGFWQSNQKKESQLAGWFWVAPMHHEYQGKLWVREQHTIDSSALNLAQELFSTA
ncbi:MAG: hypothetical protein MK073_00970 [Phycisphaerales bacterium]|nr:hypothetical protein [Phycisphaerales bacterium]